MSFGCIFAAPHMQCSSNKSICIFYVYFISKIQTNPSSSLSKKNVHSRKIKQMIKQDDINLDLLCLFFLPNFFALDKRRHIGYNLKCSTILKHSTIMDHLVVFYYFPPD